MSGRDEKGLTLSGRALLRLFVEFKRTERFLNRMNVDTNIPEMISESAVAVRVADLLVLAKEMSKRIGSDEEMETYLRSREDEDDDWFRKNTAEERKQVTKKQQHALVAEIEEALLSGPPCAVCHKPKCVACDECHHCANKKRREKAN